MKSFLSRLSITHRIVLITVLGTVFSTVAIVSLVLSIVQQNLAEQAVAQQKSNMRIFQELLKAKGGGEVHLVDGKLAFQAVTPGRGELGRVNTNGRTVYQGRYLLAWKSRPSSSHVLNIAFPPNAATSA